MKSAWTRYLNWCRQNAARMRALPEWHDDDGFASRWLYPSTPALVPCEMKILASYCWLSDRAGMVWLTNQRLIFKRTVWNLWLGTKNLDLPREQIVLVRRRSRLRSLLSYPFFGSFEIKTANGKTYVIQAMKAERWVEELSKTTPDASKSDPTPM